MTLGFPPSPPADTPFPKVSVLTAGMFTMPEHLFIAPVDTSSRSTVPSMSFLIQFTSNGKPVNVVFDLGIRNPLSDYSGPLQNHIKSRVPIDPVPDVVANLKAGGLTPGEIDFVVFSHVHWDHIGNPKYFSSPKTTFVVGDGAIELIDHGMPGSKGSHSHFEQDLPRDRTVEVPLPSAGHGSDAVHLKLEDGQEFVSTWTELGEDLFSAADLFGTQKIYLVDAPGHLQGHINLLVNYAPEKWLLLAGDACHDRRILTGEKEIGYFPAEDGHMICIHQDEAAVKKTLARMNRAVEVSGGGLEIVLAHDGVWANAHSDSYYPNHITS